MAKNGRVKNLTPQQRRAIEALLTQPSVQEAARESEVASRTLYRWLRDPNFQQALHEAEGRALGALARRLIAKGARAVDVLSEAMEGGATSLQVRAARIVLESLLKLREQYSIEERLTRLEEIVHETQEPT